MALTFTDWEGTCLVHHGIKGQKWGIRRYQNEDGTLTPEGRIHYGYEVDVRFADKLMSKGIRDRRLEEAHTIKKGTVIYRTTAGRNDYEDGSTYVSYMDVDRNHYKGGWVRNNSNSNEAYEHSYQLKEDLHVPSRKEVQEVISEVMKDKSLVRDTADSWLQVALPKNTWRYWEELDYAGMERGLTEKEAYKNLVDEQLQKFGSMPISEATFYVSQSFGLNPKVKQRVINELKDRGFNAMTDEASVGGQNGWKLEGGDPLIVFDRRASMQEISNVRISDKDEKKARKAYGKITGVY